MVFASETIRFYNICSRYKDFIFHCKRYITFFLEKKYPIHLLLAGFLSVWRSGRHDTTKYDKLSPTVWREDILLQLPQKYHTHFKRLGLPHTDDDTPLLHTTIKRPISNHTYAISKRVRLPPNRQLQFVKSTSPAPNTQQTPSGFSTLASYCALPAPPPARKRNIYDAYLYWNNRYAHLPNSNAKRNKHTTPSNSLWIRDAILGGNTIIW